MNQMDMTGGNAMGRLEPVGPGMPEMGGRPPPRITPQVPASARLAEVNGDGRPAPTRPGFGPSDTAALHTALTSGQDGLARKSDLGEMHRHTVKLFQTLNKGLGEQHVRKAAEDRSALIARMDRLEKSVNAMEGAVRIEMAPLIREMLNEAVAGLNTRQARRDTRALWLGGGLAIGLVVGVVFAGDIAPLADSLLTKAAQFVERLMGS